MHNKRRMFCMRGKLCHECEQACVCFVFFLARCFQSRRHILAQNLEQWALSGGGFNDEAFEVS